MTLLERVAQFPSADEIGDDDVEWMLARIRELEALVRRVEWAGDFCDGPACPVCLAAPWRKSHAPGCALAAALKNLEGP